MSDDTTMTETATTAVANATETVAAATETVVETAAEALPEPVKSAVVKTVRATKAATVKAAATVAEVAKPVAKRRYKTRAKKVGAPIVKAVTKAAAPVKIAAPVKKRKYVRKPIAVATLAAAPLIKGNKAMSYELPSMFTAFTTLPGADKFKDMFTDVSAKGQDAVKKSQAFAEQMTEAAKANVEAMVESTKIATAGARDLGQEVVASTKTGVEHASSAMKTLTEAKSPTEFFQLQSDLMKSSFDRMVSEGSKFTEPMVKLAGESIQPLSNRASVSAEKFSELTA